MGMLAQTIIARAAECGHVETGEVDRYGNPVIRRAAPGGRDNQGDES